MKTSNLEFPYPARRVYTACMSALCECGVFHSVDGDQRTFRISASKGMPIFGENLTVNVIATSSSSCHVTMKSTDKLPFNPLKFGNNVRNVKDIDQFIRNEVYRICDSSQLSIQPQQIKLTKPEIRLR